MLIFDDAVTSLWHIENISWHNKKNWLQGSILLTYPYHIICFQNKVLPT